MTDLKDRSGQPEDLSELKSKAEQGDADAQYTLVDLCYREWDALGANKWSDPREETAKKWYGLAAKQGHPEAQFCLAGFLKDPADGEPTAESAKWYQAAAEQGHAEACMSLCYCILEVGDGNEREAIKWYRRARELGHPHDAEILCYFRQDTKLTGTSSEWQRKYAEAGDRRAQHYIGKLYLTGQDYGYPLNFIHAYAWCAVAANHVPGATVEELHEQREKDSYSERQTPEGIIRLLEHIFDEDERDQAHRLASGYLEKFGQEQVWRLKMLGWCESLYGKWRWNVLLLFIVIVPVLALLLLYYLWIAVVAAW